MHKKRALATGGGGGEGAYIRNNVFVSANGWAYIRGL